MAMLWADQIIRGNRTYSQVPNGLKVAVAATLDRLGYTDLVE